MRYLIISIIFLLAISCSSDDTRNYNNPYLISTTVNLQLNLNLPQYKSLQYPGNHVIVYHQGIKGIVIYALNADLYIAHELSDPNHFPNNCSTMTVTGAIASCPCPDDDNSYDLITGQHSSSKERYPMLQYRAKREGNSIRVYN